MKPGLFSNFPSKEEKEKIRSKSISSLQNLKLKQIKPNPTLNNLGNLSRIYAQDSSTLTKNMIDSFSPSSKKHDFTSAGKTPSCKKSNSRLFISAKSEISMKKGAFKKKSPIVSSRTKQNTVDLNLICVEESLSTTINSNGIGVFGGPNSAKQKFSRVLSNSTMEKLSKDQSVVLNDSGGEFRSQLVRLFEKFRSKHDEILKMFKHK